MSRPATPADVDRICAELPQTEFGTSWGDVPTWLVPAGEKGRGFALYRRPHKTAVDPVTGQEYDDLLVIRCANADDKAALVASGPYFDIDHFRNYNAVLVRLSRLGEIDVEELTEVLTEAWCAVAPKRLVAQFRGE